MDIHIYPGSDELSHAAAEYVVRIAQKAINRHGTFTLALSGGSTPKKLYGLLATEPYRSQIAWPLVEVFWSDERCVPPDDPESNYRMANEVMLSKLPIPSSNIHRVPADAEDRDAASLAYATEIQRVLGATYAPEFDLIQLGMGPEGHTASLFPQQSSLEEQQKLIMPVSVPKPPPARLTFTPPLLNAAQHILFLVTGAEKEDAVQAVLEGDYEPAKYPAQIVRPSHGSVTWMLDTGAANKLSKKLREQ